MSLSISCTARVGYVFIRVHLSIYLYSTGKGRKDALPSRGKEQMERRAPRKDQLGRRYFSQYDWPRSGRKTPIRHPHGQWSSWFPQLVQHFPQCHQTLLIWNINLRFKICTHLWKAIWPQKLNWLVLLIFCDILWCNVPSWILLGNLRRYPLHG